MYTYTFLRRSERPLALPIGIAGELTLFDTDRLSAVVEPELPFEALQGNDEALLRAALDHDRVIRDLFVQQPLLPLRFGTRFLSADGLREHLASHGEDYLARLDRLVGRAEYTLRLLPLEMPPEVPSATEVSGREYFLARKRRYEKHQAHEAAQSAQLEALVELVTSVAVACQSGESQEGLQRLHLLAEHAFADVMYEHLRSWQLETPDWKLEIEGPLPPYHFV